MPERQILIKNAAIITGRGPVYPDGYIHMREGRIAAIGSAKSLRRAAGAITIDAGGRYVLPGFINPHMHLYSMLARGMELPRMRSFGQVLEGLWWKLDRALTLEDVYVSAKLGAVESLRAGVTTIFDHHASYGAIMGSLGAVAKGVCEAGLRASLCFEISDRGGKRARDTALDESASWLELARAELAEDPRYPLRGMVGLHASMTLSDETIGLARSLMEVYGAHSHVHVAEAREDVELSRREYRATPAARFMKAGVLNECSIAAHCVHVTAGEISGLAKKGICVAHNPMSNLGNAVGVAPVLEMVREGVPVAVGTDGMSASVAYDIKLASVLHKISHRDAQAGWGELEYMVFGVAPWLASNAFGYDVGHLKKGAAADIVVSEARPATPLTGDNSFGHVMFGILGAPFRTVIVDGRIRMKDFRIAGVDEIALAKEARRRAKALWKRMK
jgi:putative selenium metabolism protein SsnA